MSIWIEPISLEHIAQRSANTMAEHLAIHFIDVGDDYLKATMPVDQRTKQPLGYLNGGASCALAETVASTAANYCVDQKEKYCVGLSLTANHLRPATQGLVTAMAKPIHLGNKTQVWEVSITDQQNKLICVIRMTMAVVVRDQ